MTVLSSLNLRIPLGRALAFSEADANFTVLGTAIDAISSADGISYLAPYTGAVATTQSEINSRIVNVFDKLSAVQKADVLAWTFTQDLTSTLTALVAALPANTTLVFPSGGYFASLSVRRSNITLQGAGSASCMIKAAGLAPGGVIELGDTASGNSATAYTNVNVRGFTLDGNNGVITAPTDDLHGHGLIMTKISYSVIDDLVAQNCHMTGLDTVINSNYNRINVRVKNCGTATVYSGHYPNFDINGSKYSIYDVVSEGGYYGARMLDNCYGIHLRATVYNASVIGVALNNQTVNESHGNRVEATVIGGCTAAGVAVLSNWRNGIVNAAISDVTGPGFKDVGVNDGILAANVPTGNIYNVVTRNGQAQSCYIGSDYNTWNIQSYLDGRGGAQGASYAVDVQSTHNLISAVIQDSATWQVRGLVFRPTSSNNKILAFDTVNTASPFSNSGTNNSLALPVVIGAELASGDNLYPTGPIHHVTGTGAVATINLGQLIGQVPGTLTLIPDGAFTTTTAGNIALASTAVVGKALVMTYDPATSKWYPSY